MLADSTVRSTQVRLHLAAWIEERFAPQSAAQLAPDADPAHKEACEQLAAQLLHQLDTVVQGLPADQPDKFLLRQKLAEVSETLKVSVDMSVKPRIASMARYCRAEPPFCQWRPSSLSFRLELLSLV